MKKALSLLFAVSVYFSFAVMPLLAGETIFYDGSDITMLKTVNGNDNSLAPSGSESSSSNSKSNSLSDNSITVSSNVAGAVYGAVNSILGDTDAVTGNSVTINGGTIYRSVNGGYARAGNATGNSVIVNGGTASNNLVGGYSNSGNAVDNSVTINGGTMSMSAYGGWSDNGNATGNSVIVNGGTVNNFVYGGYSSSSNAANNIVTINGGTVSNSVYGGRSGSGNAANNIVTINGGTISNSVYGGSSDSGNATGNSLTITSGTVSISAFGGHSNSGNAAYNSLTITSGTVNISAFGGYSNSGNATGNSLTITSGTVRVYAYGGRSDTGNAIGNILTINGGTLRGNVHGGSSDNSGDATDNILTINGGALREDAFGGYAVAGNATDNSVTITSGTVSSSVYGGRSGSGNAANNIVTINGGTVSNNVHGGYSSSGNTTGNSVTITSGTVGGYVYGGRSDIGNAIGNILTINGGTLSWDAFGGYATASNATGNSVTINGGTLNSYVYGGFVASSGNAAGNNLTINGGIVTANIHGAYSEKGDVVNNNVIINSEVNADVYGGYVGVGSGNATGNSVTINNGTVGGGNIFGGYVNHSISGSATFNTVTIYSSGYSYHDSVIYGGFVGTSTTAPAIGADVRTGNTFNVMGTNVAVKGIQNFENYNFYLPDNVSDNSTMLYVTAGDGFGKPVDITDSKISISVSGKVTLNENDIIYLIDTYGNGIDAASINTETTALFGISKFYDFDLDVLSGRLYAIYTGSRVNPQTKILSEGVAAGAILAGQGADNINGGLLSGLQEGKVEMFGSFFGGSSKYDTGSSVEMSVFGAAAGIGKKFETISAGIFVEYANGSFDTEYNSLKGDGQASAIGGGILAKKDINENIYVEGLIRAGQVSNDYKSKIADGMGVLVDTDFDYSAMYFGISLGAGRIFQVNEKVNVDAFAKYALTNTGGGKATLSNGDKYEFDSILSNKIKAGAKGEYKMSETIKPYLSLSYDYELSGDVNAKIDGYEIEAPSLNGGTFSGGLGVNAKVAEKLTLDLSAQIYSGVRDGVIGSLQVKYEF